MARFFVTVGLVVSGLLAGCANQDPAERFIRMMDARPPDKRVPNWQRVKAMMLRPAPQPGDPAPDFTLATLDGSGRITLSQYRPGQPRFLVFGSYT